MGILETFKKGFTGYTPEERAEIEAAKEEAKATTKQLKEEARRKRLTRTVERIKQEPYTRPAKQAQQREQIKAKVGGLAKSAYTNISGFGNQFGEQAKSQPQQPPQPHQDPWAAFGGNLMSNPSPRGQTKPKKGKSHKGDPFDVFSSGLLK